jgi:hypothetical protein
VHINIVKIITEKQKLLSLKSSNSEENQASVYGTKSRTKGYLEKNAPHNASPQNKIHRKIHKESSCAMSISHVLNYVRVDGTLKPVVVLAVFPAGAALDTEAVAFVGAVAAGTLACGVGMGELLLNCLVHGGEENDLNGVSVISSSIIKHLVLTLLLDDFAIACIVSK